MSTATATTPKSFLDRHYHLIRRLHSLSGVFPIGLFLIPHLTTNSSILWGKALNGSKFADRGITDTAQHVMNLVGCARPLRLDETLQFGFDAGDRVSAEQLAQLFGPEKIVE